MFNTAPPKPTMNQIKQTPFLTGGEFGSSPTPMVSGGAFGASPSFGVSGAPFMNNGAFAAPVQPVQDPWAPIPSNTSSHMSPWTKSTEQPNPFLS